MSHTSEMVEEERTRMAGRWSGRDTRELAGGKSVMMLNW